MGGGEEVLPAVCEEEEEERREERREESTERKRGVPLRRARAPRAREQPTYCAKERRQDKARRRRG